MKKLLILIPTLTTFFFMFNLASQQEGTVEKITASSVNCFILNKNYTLIKIYKERVLQSTKLYAISNLRPVTDNYFNNLEDNLICKSFVQNPNYCQSQLLEKNFINLCSTRLQLKLSIINQKLFN